MSKTEIDQMNYFVPLSYFNSESVQHFVKAYERGMKCFLSDTGFKAEVFVPQMHCVLSNNNVPIEYSTNTFDGQQFIKPYIEGYKKGVDYFKNNHELNANTLYNNSEQYVKDLHICYFHHDPVLNDKNKGWCWWETHFPFNYSEEQITTYGFYAGIISELKRIKSKHPAIFKNFRFKCEIENKKDESSSLEQIFDAFKPGYTICLQLFKELEFVDNKGNTNLKLTAGEIIGLIDALKQTKHELFAKESQKLTFNELMQTFQTHLKVPFTPNIKRRNVGYENTKSDALKLIDSYMK